MKLTQYNIKCMSEVLNLDPLLVQPTDIYIDTSVIKNKWICKL